MDSQIGFEMILIVVEAIRRRCASFKVLTATVSEIFGGQTTPSILLVLSYYRLGRLTPSGSRDPSDPGVAITAYRVYTHTCKLTDDSITRVGRVALETISTTRTRQLIIRKSAIGLTFVGHCHRVQNAKAIQEASYHSLRRGRSKKQSLLLDRLKQ